jgi:hypothetical protein
MSSPITQEFQQAPASLPSVACAEPVLRGMLCRALAQRDFSHYLTLFDSHKRMRPFLELIPSLDDAEYWVLLRSVWISTETTYPHTAEWLALLQASRPDREALMSPEDREVFDSLPETLTVFRGCDSAAGARGLSWTTDLERAVKFAHYSCGPRRLIFGGRKHYRAFPRVMGGTCEKSDVLAYFNERGEQEIVINPEAVSFNPVPVWPFDWAS